MKLVKLSSIASAVLALATAAFAPAAIADSSSPAAGNAAANLDFQIVIPRVLTFRVGAAAAIDMIQFNPTAAQVGAGGAGLAGTGGDLGAGAVTASVRGNNGQVTLTATTTGALTNGGTGTIPWSQITTTPTVLTSATALPAPVIPLTGASAAVNAALAAGITNQDARWTYRFLNTAIPQAGTYGGVNVRNGRVVYTAAMP